MNSVNRYPLAAEDLNVQHFTARNQAVEDRLFVLIHGFMSSSYSFHLLIPELRGFGEVVTLDLPGFGESVKKVKYRYSYEQYAKTVKAVIDEFASEYTMVIPVGHSMGGQVALRLALLMPDTRKRLVLLASSDGMSRSPSWLRIATFLPFFSWWLSRYVRRRDVRKVLAQVIYDESSITEAQVASYQKPLQEHSMFRALAKFIRHREDDLDEGTLKNINVPVLLLWGKADRIVPLYVGKKLVNRLPDAKLVVYPRKGHLLPEEMPVETARAISLFVEN
ncbi:pimeloyl-ACP methyl ester carboxylesterase [Geomicrobium halophilum]|uniref:Pimeloyl-ACP methyl ester carboxylesterase n=1 Tax=Geomicrobium halophilum TaxID=549000 RepID=A0A841PYF4_9BACL|nr:alpha/beta hydrolase [Geomicrobium halophilum]MBB6449195.1 pimeloyl-ACP methyl ester carboxylesterase [Geomicrobium halophilum]